MAATLLTAPDIATVPGTLAPEGSAPEVGAPEIDPRQGRYERNKAYAKNGPYETALNPNQEKQFLQWVTQNNIRFDPTEKPNDYDMRGFYKASILDKRIPRYNTKDPDAHFPDEFKTPYHETFSNESRYATPDAPRWVPVGEDFHLTDKKGNVLFIDDTSKLNKPKGQ